MKKILSVALLLVMIASVLASCGTGITVDIEYIVNGETYQTNTFSGSSMPTLASDPKSDEPCAVFDGWYYDENVWKEPLTLQSLQEIQLKEKSSIKVYAHFKYEHNFENGVCTNCNVKQQEADNNNPSAAEDFIYEILTSHDGSSKITLKGISNTSATKIVVPGEINGIRVTEIVANTFFALQKLEEVVIPESVEFVQADAFVNCANLKKVTFLSSKMKTLYDGTFKGCTSLETIAVPNPIIIQEYLFALPSLKTIEFNGTLEESKNGLHLGTNSSKPGVILKCTDGERLLCNYEGALFYQNYSDKPSVHQGIYRYAELPSQLPEGYVKSSLVLDFSLEQIESAYRSGELNGANYFVCDAETVNALIAKNLIGGYDASVFGSDRRIPDGYWDDFKRGGLTYAFAVPVTKYSFDGGTPIVRGNTDVAYLVCLNASDGKSHINEIDLHETIAGHFDELRDYYLNN